LGALNIYAVEPDAFSEDEVKLLGELAYDLAYGIQALRTRAGRARAEQTLRMSEEKYRTLVDNIQDGVFVIQDAKMQFINGAFARMLGYTVEEVTGMAFRQLIAPEDLEMVADRYRRRQAGEDVPNEYGFCMLHKDGASRVIVNMNVGLVDYQGRVVDIGTVKDITEQIRAREALREVEERYQLIVENQTELISRRDREGRQVFANEAYRRFFDKPSEEFGKIDVFETIAKEDRAAVRDILATLNRNNPMITSENSIIAPDGRRVWMEWTNRALFDEIGNLIGFQSVGRDISARKQAEEALKRSFVQLAETVSRAMESQDPYTASHQRQVAELAKKVGEKLDLDQDRLLGLYIGSLLHDIGKISIPAEILTHPGKLEDAEWALIRSHPRRGYDILKQAVFPWPVAEMALHHHERLDGSGYPDGLKDDELSLEVRILAACDVVDAMSSNRPYRPGKPADDVIAELAAGKGTRYESGVADILIEIIENGELELTKG